MDGNMSQNKNGSGSYEDAYNILEKTNETPKYYKDFDKSYERNKDYYKNNGDKSNIEEIREKPYPIKEGISLSKLSDISSIYFKDSQKEKEKDNENRSQEGIEGQSNSSLFLSFNESSNQQKVFLK